MLAPRTKAAASGTTRLAVWCGAIGVLWLVLLPWMASRPAMRERLDWLDERQIDPGAMYYTELDAMQPILQRLNERERKRGLIAR